MGGGWAPAVSWLGMGFKFSHLEILYFFYIFNAELSYVLIPDVVSVIFVCKNFVIKLI